MGFNIIRLKFMIKLGIGKSEKYEKIWERNSREIEERILRVKVVNIVGM